jgi:hypothetical protein
LIESSLLSCMYCNPRRLCAYFEPGDGSKS